MNTAGLELGDGGYSGGEDDWTTGYSAPTLAPAAAPADNGENVQRCFPGLEEWVVG